MYDLMIIGGGSAGLAASIYAARKQLKTLLISVDIRGGDKYYPGYLELSGLYAAGDVTDVPEKQIVVAAGEGTKAILQAHRYLQRLD